MEYMSQEGFDKIANELHNLETTELSRVRDAIAEARDKGDLSENFEYHAAKREQGRLSVSCSACWRMHASSTLPCSRPTA